MAKVILGTGSALASKVVTNHDIEATSVDYDRVRSGSPLHDWVMKRVGVEQRNVVERGEGTSDLALAACRRALDDARVDAHDIDLIVLSTFSSDYRLPGTISIVQAELGTRAKCFQLEAACAGFIDGMINAAALMDAIGYRTALVVHAEVLSQFLAPRSFMHRSIFGDGAGAVVLRSLPDDDFAGYGLRASTTYTDGSIGYWTFIPNGTKAPVDEDALATGSHFLQLDHKNVYNLAVSKMAEMSREVVSRAGSTLDDVDWIIPHQTGMNIIEDVAKDLGVGMDRFRVCIDHTGNISGATIPYALDEANREGALRHGDHLVLPSVGGGMAWGALDVVWADRDVVGDAG
jgi:3-oxoacyl-[acyl-carrier-protein] synthase-3